ncbi:PfkB family carbohydrate kinase [Reichenbachiella agarivorans]|uniref:PfkB family carbohydrate kinase n=1 Tax=Reichenbachiella agarivorans TaxID=2979464 RepID=A0ABY6CP15_9BACT|nr:PfkB family carbohydrate kinase [Reichenbachiella agarivorans]UXP32257.1 PfkB family carbohydrate kinase [Reichenbachiella agarivorans]
MKKRVLVVCPNPAIDIYAYIDHFNVGIPNRITKEKKYPGGKGLHVGMALSELGIEVTIAGFWGGESGQWIKKSCNEYYPNIQFIGTELEQWSRSCYTFKSEGNFDDTEILGTGPEIQKQDFQAFIESIESHLPSTVMVVLSGSWPKGSPENGYAEIIRIAQQANIKSMLDCTGKQLENALMNRPYAVHLNRKEITDFYQCDFDKAKQQILQSCELAAITDGAKGLSLLTSQGTYHSLAKIDKVLSTIGAGDCLTAGVVAGIVEKLDPQSIANLGAACGAANCKREDLGMLYISEVKALLYMMV